MSDCFNNPKLLWSPDRSIRTQQDEFRDLVNTKFNTKLGNYEDLYKWSVDKYADFWATLWDYSSVKYTHNYDQVIDLKQKIGDIPEWFQGAKMNFAENILRHKDDKIAIYSTSETDRTVKTTSFAELRVRVAMFASAMKEMGVAKGDRVVGYLPNCTLAIEAMLAASSIGAIWSVTSPDFGVTGVLDRFSQIKPKMIFSVEAVVYNGKVHDHLGKLNKVVQNLPEIENVIILPYVEKTESKINISDIKNSMFLSKFLGPSLISDEPLPLTFEPLAFNHPLYIMYSSGTTGTPKCIVHSAGGTLIKHIEEHMLQGNLTQKDILFYFTTTGWMMWNWQLSALFTGASIVLYDGSPFLPTPAIMFDLIDSIGITVFGTGAKYLAVLEQKGLHPRQTHSLTSLRCILSTGSPLKPTSFEYVYDKVKSDLLLGSITGGTDIIACFAGNNCTGSVYCGEIQCRMLGIAMECFDNKGDAVTDQEGELVCVKPFPSQPIYFWNDPNELEQGVGPRYMKAYFSSQYGNQVWAHSDFCRINGETGGVWMLGRSDGTLNPNGVRFGSSEIYHIVEQIPEISDSLCVSQYKKRSNADSPSIDGEERVILFVMVKSGGELDGDLISKIKSSIRQQLSAHHVPSVILNTKEIPYTHNGKKIEVAVKKVISGESVKCRGSFANPNSLDLYSNLEQLKGY